MPIPSLVARSVLAALALPLALAAPVAQAADQLLYTFDGVTDPVTSAVDSSVNAVHGVVATNGKPGALLSKVSPGHDGAGDAIGYPAVCPNTDTNCARAIVSTPDNAALNPGDEDFSYGLRVRVTLAQLTADHGSNLLQKGIYNSSQWKLQLDDAAQGRPSCVLRPTVDPANSAVLVRSSVGVADGAWHELRCVRTGDTLSIVIDGVVRGSKPFSGTVDPSGHALTIGGSGSNLKNDQFHGTLDQVHVATSSTPAYLGFIYDFDAAVSPVTSVVDDTGNGHHATVSGNGQPGASLTPVPGSMGVGQALAFPASCPNSNSSCPRVLLTTPDHAELNPEADDFSYGVRLRVTAANLGGDHGSNLLQKGLWNTSQWKLQLDASSPGRPSCVLRPTVDPSNSGVSVKAPAGVGVADGQWHEIICRKSGGTLTLFIDGVAQASKPFTGDVAPTGQPLTIGGAGTYISNEQFHGELDKVWLERTP